MRTWKPTILVAWSLVTLIAVTGHPARAQKFNFGVRGDTLACGNYRQKAVVWYGADRYMSIKDLAAYCGPVMWFSPDEPLLEERNGTDITVPQAFPFEPSSGGPVVYYRVRHIQMKPDAMSAYQTDPNDRGESVMDLESIVGIDLDYFFYYPEETGLSGHKHDVESAEFQVVVWKRNDCPEPYHLLVTRVLGKAHGVQWYDNTLAVDEYSKFPMHLLVEEGKHATCTDKNADGYYTPGFDVNRRTNDAWGVRDVISSGTLFTATYQSWMTKVRRPEDRVFPPLPVDSPLRAQFVVDGVYSPDNAVYELRPFPSAEQASKDLEHFISSKGSEDWPEVVETGSLGEFANWVDREPFTKSLSVAFYTDGDVGFSIAFPFFIVKNLEAPMTGGFITHRMEFTDKNLRDFTWLANYSTSASRWMDPYVAMGVEFDKEDGPPGEGPVHHTSFALETGLKFRASLEHSPMRFMTKVADFWGLRLGVKANGFFEIDTLRYIVEVGAGTW